MDAIFKGIFENELTQLISVQDFLLCFDFKFGKTKQKVVTLVTTALKASLSP